MSIPTRLAIWIALSFSPSGIGYSLPLMMMVAIVFPVPSGSSDRADARRLPRAGRCRQQAVENRQPGATVVGLPALRDVLLQPADFVSRCLVRADVVLELATELGDGVLDRPGGAVGQAADRRAGHDA